MEKQGEKLARNLVLVLVVMFAGGCLLLSVPFEVATKSTFIAGIFAVFTAGVVIGSRPQRSE